MKILYMRQIIKDGIDWLAYWLPYRHKFCGILGHRYLYVPSKDSSKDVTVFLPDKYSGCIFCGKQPDKWEFELQLNFAKIGFTAMYNFSQIEGNAIIQIRNNILKEDWCSYTEGSLIRILATYRSIKKKRAYTTKHAYILQIVKYQRGLNLLRQKKRQIKMENKLC